jgi:hypothetical protein
LVVANTVPPVAVAYQTTFPALEVADNVTLPASQRLAGEVEVIDGVELTVAVTAVLVEVQVPLAAST